MSDYNDLSDIPDAEKMVTCPYNKAHLVLRKRFDKHVHKCGLSYKGPKMMKCTFNMTHIFPPSEINQHIATCPDRLFIEKHLQAFGPIKRKAPEENGEQSSTAADDADEWGDEGSYQRESLSIDERKRRCLESNKIVHHQHTTPSQRKADRLERHRRIQEREHLENLSDISDE